MATGGTNTRKLVYGVQAPVPQTRSRCLLPLPVLVDSDGYELRTHPRQVIQRYTEVLVRSWAATSDPP